MTRPDGPSVSPDDPVQRTLRFLAWFGLVYAAASLPKLLDSWRVVSFVLQGGGFSRNYARERWAMIGAASIVLLIGCIGILRRWRNAGAILFAWSVLVIAVELAGWVAYQGRRFSQGYMPPMISYGALSLTSIVAGLGLPLMILGVLRACRERAGAGFMVITSSPSPPGDSPAVEPGSSRDLLRWTAWLALAMGIFGIAQVVIQTNWLGFPRVTETPWRDALVRAIFQVRAYSACLLLAGAILLLRRHAIGRRIIIAWAMVYLVLVTLGFVFHDMLHVYWEMANSGYREFVFRDAADRAYNLLRSSSFAIIALYVLMQPGIAGEAAEPGPATQRTPRSVVYDAGDTPS